MYLIRKFFNIGLIIAILIFIAWSLIFSLTYCIIMTDKYVGSERSAEQRRHISANNAMRNGRMMKIVTKLPYGKFMLKEARDCPICLESFNDQAQVVQLKCSKFHIFHFECLESLMQRGPDQQCPLCRKPVEIQDKPILNV